MAEKLSNVERVRGVLECIDAKDFDRALEIMGDTVFTSPGTGTTDPAGWRTYSEAMAAAFPDGKHTELSCIESGNRVAMESTWTGTHTGTLATPQGDLPPTGAKVELHWGGFFEDLGNDKFSVRIYFDQMEFAQQLGLVPANA